MAAGENGFGGALVMTYAAGSGCLAKPFIYERPQQKETLKRFSRVPMSPRIRSVGKISPGLAGTAGEYLVAGELSRRGYIASITIRNARGIDILASDEDARRSVGIQVKTSQGSKASWILNQKIEKMDTAENLYFVLVVLNGLAEPAYHIVPRKKLIREVTTRHRDWLSAPGKKGQQRKDSSMRKFEDAEGRYRDRWDLLGLD